MNKYNYLYPVEQSDRPLAFPFANAGKGIGGSTLINVCALLACFHLFTEAAVAYRAWSGIVLLQEKWTRSLALLATRPGMQNL